MNVKSHSTSLMMKKVKKEFSFWVLFESRKEAKRIFFNLKGKNEKATEDVEDEAIEND